MQYTDEPDSARTLILRHAWLATMAEGTEGVGILGDAAVVIQGERIAWIGPDQVLPTEFAGEEIDCDHRWITPGLIDCHTHLVYAGNRAHEFEMRLDGATYEEIARAGGGIVSTVSSVRAATDDEMYAESRRRLEALRSEGVTTVEIKSGYGLDVESEQKMLRVAGRLADRMTVRRTFLGAHATPPEYAGRSDEYIDLVVNEMLPAIIDAGIADAVDGFCEGIAFSPEQIRRVFDAASHRGLPVKLHADQLSDLGGGALVAEYGGLSADHLEYTSEASVRAMAEAGTVAVLLPGATYFLREEARPPIDLMRQYGCHMAVATDSNPGTSPLTSLLLTMNMAATLMRLTVPECLVGCTRNAALALGLGDQIGTLEVGKIADLAIWEIEDPAELVYRIGFNPLWKSMYHGAFD